MATQPGEKVKLEAMISRETTSTGEFAVLVQVTAPQALHTEHPDSAGMARGVDLVAVLDISASMNEENKLERMKEAMFSVLDQLGPEDRLCILSFNDEVHPVMELSFMSDENWATARATVEDLTAPAGGGANVKAATEAAATILAKRGEEEQRDRVGRVVFLSNGGEEEEDVVADTGSQKQNDATSTSSPELTPDAFVLGADDKLRALSFSTGNTSAAYSCVDEDVDKIMDAPGLMSVEAAMGVQVELHAQDGVTISSIESGSSDDPVSVGPDGPRSLTVYIQDLYAGEQKSFTVYLAAPDGKEELLAVTGWYRDAESGEDVQLDVCEVSVPPPIAEDAPVDEDVNPQVPSEIDRIQENKETVQEKKQDTPDVQEHKATIPDEKQDMPDIVEQEKTVRDENKGTPASVSEQVSVPPPTAAAPVEEAVNPQVPAEMDRIEEKKEIVPEMVKDMPDVQEHKDTIPNEKRDVPPNIPKQVKTIQDMNKATPASFQEQVVVVPGEQTVSGSSLFLSVSVSLSGMCFAVRNLLFWVWGSVAKKAKTLKNEELKFGKVKILRAWARNNPYPCALVLLLLGAATLLVARKADHNGKSSSLGVPQQPSWPQMEESFDLVMLKEMENAGITSCFNSASVTDKCPSMNRYIYQVIVHGRGVHVPLLGQTAHKAEMGVSMAASCEEKSEVVQHANSNAHFQDLRGER